MASQYFLRMDGISGDATDPRHRGWFTLDALQMASMVNTGAIGGRSAQVPAFNNLTFTVEQGPSTAQLIAAVQQRKSIRSGEIDIVTNGATNSRNLTDIVLLSANVAGRGQNAASIHLSLRCRIQSAALPAVQR